MLHATHQTSLNVDYMLTDSKLQRDLATVLMQWPQYRVYRQYRQNVSANLS